MAFCGATPDPFASRRKAIANLCHAQPGGLVSIDEMRLTSIPSRYRTRLVYTCFSILFKLLELQLFIL